ncbi:uncharacterized protein LOC141674312 [Apium graveolens]|uniref:uncharacterized protein LOC141674312 n=1 Tax=Apium graveolens TaxID=4045 RepID=UPI003D7A9090
MDALEELNAATKLAASKRDMVEKVLLSLVAEWNSLLQIDSSTRRLLHDCFTDIQSREERLNALQQSVTYRSKVLDERTNSLENRLEEAERKEKSFIVMYEEKSKELKLRMKKFNFCKGFIDRRMKDFDLREEKIDEKKKLIEGIYEKFCLERSEFEKIEGLMDSRFEEVKLMEKKVEDREIELNRILVEFDVKVKNMVEKEKEIEVKEKSIKNREIKLDRVSAEFDVKMKNVVEKEKELELKERSFEDLKHNLDKTMVEIDVRMKNVVEKEKELDLKEKSIENCDIELDGALVEFDLIKKRVEEKEEELEAMEKSLGIQKIELDRGLVEFHEKKKNVVKKEKELDLKEKELALLRIDNEKKSKKLESRVESNNAKLSNQNLCRGYNSHKGDLNLEKKVVDKKKKELETKEKYFKEWVETIDSKEREVDSKIFSSEERYKELEIMEKKLADQLKEFELKENHFKEWVETIDLKVKEVNSVRILNEERCKKLDSIKKNLHDFLNVSIMKEQHLQDRSKSFKEKEKEVDKIRISSEERCKKLELEKRKLEDQMKELKVKNKQFSNVDHSIVKPEPWCDDDGSYADIRFSITMDGKNLLLYLINHKMDLDSVTDSVYNALRLSMDPAKIVLNALQDLYVIKEDKELEEDVVCKISILLLVQLRRISPHIQSYHKKIALELASKWKGKMKSSTEVVVFLHLLASYRLSSAFVPEEFSSLFEVIGPQTQISELFQLLGYPDQISDRIEVMLKEKRYVKAVEYVCVFGLREKFQPATLLKEFLKNALEVSKTLCENISSPVNKKDEAIDNIVASLHEALACIIRYKLESDYPPECIEMSIQRLAQQKEDENGRLSASNNDVEEQDTENICKSNKSSPEPTESCITWVDHEADDPKLSSKSDMALILADMNGKRLLMFLNENVEDHGLICNYVFDALKSSRESAKLVLDAIQGFHPRGLEIEDKHYKSTTIMRSCILLLEQLMKLSPEINPQVKEDAVRLALQWKAKTRTPLEILCFLHLIAAYNLNSNFEPSELEQLFETVSYLPHASQLCRVIQLMTSNHDMISSSNCHWHHKNSSGLKIQENTNNGASVIESTNSVKLVLDAMRNCYHSNLNDNRNLHIWVVKSFINLVDELLKNPRQIQPDVEEEAIRFALDWKTRIVDDRNKNPVEVLGLFYLLAICNSSVDSDELFGLFDRIYVQRKAPETVRLLRLEHKIPDFIRGLMKKDRLQAIRYIYEFKLVGNFRPVSILKDHICSQNLLPPKINWKKISSELKGKAMHKQLASLRAAVKCIKDHHLEVQYPPHNLLARIQQLEEQLKETTKRSEMPKKLGRKRHAAGSLEAQTQWCNRKHPRIEPLVETSLNVPPAFHSTKNVISCEEAYMRKKIMPLAFNPQNELYG